MGQINLGGFNYGYSAGFQQDKSTKFLHEALGDDLNDSQLEEGLPTNMLGTHQVLLECGWSQVGGAKWSFFQARVLIGSWRLGCTDA